MPQVNHLQKPKGRMAFPGGTLTTNFVYDFGILMPRQSGNKHEDSQKGSKTQGKP
jgi:hypothetical protein